MSAGGISIRSPKLDARHDLRLVADGDHRLAVATLEVGGEEVLHTSFVCDPDHEHKVALAIRTLIERLPKMRKCFLRLGNGGRHLGISIFYVTLFSSPAGGEQRHQNSD